jgi:hypothetical protein
MRRSLGGSRLSDLSTVEAQSNLFVFEALLRFGWWFQWPIGLQESGLVPTHDHVKKLL